MLLKECLKFAVPGAYDRFADLARTIGKATAEDSDEAAAAKFMDAVEVWLKIWKLPTLEEYGVDRKEFFDVIEKDGA